MSDRKRCKATKKNGDPCRAWATHGDFCTFHAPELAERRREGKSRGGKKTLGKLKGETKEAEVADRFKPKPWRGSDGDVRILEAPDPTELLVLLADTIDDVRNGDVSPQIANSVGYLAGVMVKVIEVHQYDERLKAIEEALGVT